ncbi:unnamed protein product [Coffea canephora]|uniref:Glutaredoxin domain-containing protein n=2 Tax=Coffea TaxID=13442 RepID=A0A068UD27_COFCA|nr:bifunctional monothiol glutaredoxin-S16, chloroplastic-like [Coffea arabica]CDP06465.1 unnamed protein product [Coffea canephora]
MAASFNFTSPTHTHPSRLVCPTLVHRNCNSTISSYPIPKFSFSSVRSIDPRPRPKSDTEIKRRHASVVVSALKNLSDTELVAVPPETDAVPGTFPSSSGVYAVYDGNTDLQFIGISRNIAASVVGHRKSVPELCSSIKAGVVDEPDRAALTQAWKTWMEEHISATGKVPPGNEPGNSTWVRKPPKKKSDLRLTPGRHVQLTVPLEGLIDRLVKENKVVAFIKGSRSAPLCGFSQRVVGILESEGVDYESVDVLDEEYNFGLRETLKKYSNWPTFPQIFVNGELVGGCDILSSMYEKGELAGLFRK